MGRTLLKDKGDFKLYESENGNLSFEGPERTVSVFRSGTWCVACAAPESVTTNDRVVYAFTSGYPDRESAMDRARKYAEKPLTEFEE